MENKEILDDFSLQLVVIVVKHTNYPQMESTISEFMQALIDFEAHVVHAEFLRIFGTERGDVLWNIFTSRCASSTTIFYRMLESKDRERFDNYLLTSFRLSRLKS